MPKKSQFQNLVLQQILQDYSQQPTSIQPAITLPIKPEALVPLPLSRPLLPARPGLETAAQKSGDLSQLALNSRADMEAPALTGALLPPLDPSPRSRKK